MLLVMSLIILQTRGSRIDKLKKRTSDAGVKTIDKIVDRLGLRDPSPRLKRDDLTLPRIGMAFPEVQGVVAVFLHKMGKLRTFTILDMLPASLVRRQ